MENKIEVVEYDTCYDCGAPMTAVKYNPLVDVNDEVHISCDGCGGRAGFRPIVWGAHIFTGAVYEK